MMRSARRTSGSSRAPPVKVPMASGWGSGIAPLALYVVRTGAGSASAKARSHLASALRQPRPAITRGRRAARIISAARSTSASSGLSGGGGVTAGATGTAGAPATSAGRSRCTGPRGSPRARWTACATQWPAESAVTVTPPFTIGARCAA